MDFSEEWKSLWPISSVFSAPLLSDGTGGVTSPEKSEELGPLIFNPCPKTTTQLFASPSLLPVCPPPFPELSLTRFLQTTDYETSLLPSTSSFVTGEFGEQLSDDAASYLRHNRIQLLRCGNKSAIVFFPTSENSDQLGYLVLKVKGGKLEANGKGNDVFRAPCKASHRILKLVVNPVEASSSGNYTTVGYLLSCAFYSVNWFRVSVWGIGSKSEEFFVENIGSKFFRSSSLVHACWSPHLPEESLVLLESGELYLFDVESVIPSLNSELKGKKLKVLWTGTGTEEGKWLSCAFSWHPRILIVASSNAVFLVDLRSDQCNVTCLLKIEGLVMYGSIRDDKFVAFSTAGSDGFCFTVASEQWLVLCDIRRPLMPLLQWAHNLATPSYIGVIPLSELRSSSKDDQYNWASEMGHCIIVGSFWHCEFSVFCYGPATGGTVASQVSNFHKSFYAWKFPSDLTLADRECLCGSCLAREEFSKDAIPKWVDWRQKEEIVLGFGVLDKDLSSQLCEPNGFGGFTLIRVTSSGKLESQRYFASWKFTNIKEECSNRTSRNHEDSLLFKENDRRYDKVYVFLKLECLYGYVKGGLANILDKKSKLTLDEKSKLTLDEKSKLTRNCSQGRDSEDFHQQVCEKLKACGFKKLRSSSAVSDMFKDITLPTCIREIAFGRIFTNLSVDVLRFSFSCYADILQLLVRKRKRALEFSDVPSQPQLPPFFFRKSSARGNKWSKNVKPGNGVVGPVIPLPMLPIIQKLRLKEENDAVEAENELTLKSREILEVVNQIAVSGAGSDHVVSLGEDKEEMCYSSQIENSFALLEPAGNFDAFASADATLESSFSKDKSFMTFLFKKPEKDCAPEVGLFTSLCPVDLKCDNHDIGYGPKELKSYKLLEKQFSNYLGGFKPYQEFLIRSNLQKQEE